MKLPKYTRQVGASGDAGGVRGDVGSAGAESRAISQVAGQAIGMISGIAGKINDEKTKSQSAEYSANFDRDWAVAQGEMSALPPEQQDEFYQSWRKQKSDELANAGYTKDATSALSNNLKGRFAATDIKAMGITQKAEVGAIDNSWVIVQQNALDGKGWEDPITGVVHSPEDAFKIATDARIGIDSKYTERGMKAVRGFGQAQTYTSMSKLMRTNYPAYKDAYDHSKVSEFQQQELARQEAEVEAKIETDKRKQSEDAFDDLYSRASKGLLTENEIAIKEGAEGSSHGVQFPVLSSPSANALRATITAKTGAETGLPEYKITMRRIEEMGDTGNVFDIDRVFSGMYSMSKSGVPQSKFSVGTISTMLTQIQDVVKEGDKLDFKKGWGGGKVVNKPFADALGRTLAEFETLESFQTKKGGIPLGVMDVKVKVDSLFEAYKNGDDLGEWEKENLGQWKMDNAKDEAINKYSNNPTGTDVLRQVQSDGKVATFNKETKEFLGYE